MLKNIISCRTLSKYFPKHLLRAGTAEKEESQEQEDNSGINGKG